MIILKNWKLNVREIDGRAWVDITTPEGRLGSISCLSHGGNGVKTTAAQVLDALKEALNGCTQKCQADMWADPPRDCDFPFCGCDPAANAALDAVEGELEKARMFDWLIEYDKKHDPDGISVAEFIKKGMALENVPIKIPVYEKPA